MHIFLLVINDACMFMGNLNFKWTISDINKFALILSPSHALGLKRTFIMMQICHAHTILYAKSSELVYFQIKLFYSPYKD